MFIADADIDVNGEENGHTTREERKWWQICVQITIDNSLGSALLPIF
jgi:hypothetical protein